MSSSVSFCKVHSSVYPAARSRKSTSQAPKSPLTSPSRHHPPSNGTRYPNLKPRRLCLPPWWLASFFVRCNVCETHACCCMWLWVIYSPRCVGCPSVHRPPFTQPFYHQCASGLLSGFGWYKQCLCESPYPCLWVNTCMRFWWIQT